MLAPSTRCTRAIAAAPSAICCAIWVTTAPGGGCSTSGPTFRRRERYKVEAKFTTWLYTLAHNRVVDHYRRNRALELVSLDAAGDDDDPPEIPAPATVQPERQAQARQEAARLLALVEALPPAQREAFLLHQEGGLGVDEIARVVGADREAVKSRLRYALGKLRRAMEDLPEHANPKTS
jgi:RNA polymerase sigma-70 factor (ECF subfamily)